MKRTFPGLLLMGLLILTMLNPAPASGSDRLRWNFDVYLNDKKVGNHLFEVVDFGEERRVISEADFKYKILLIPAYRYRHTNSERWAQNCLVGFDARTNANGKRIEVSGVRTEDAFQVRKEDESMELPECVMSFAYWNPEFLEEQRLLNPQTGDYIDVTVREEGEEILEVRGQPVPATRFRLTAYEVDLTLWYSADDEWLALESVAQGGHVIRYELS